MFLTYLMFKPGDFIIVLGEHDQDNLTETKLIKILDVSKVEIKMGKLKA
jgi:hypothetical protein